MDGAFQAQVDLPDVRIVTERRRAKPVAKDPKQDETRRAWARGMLDGMLSQLRPGDICLDCGAGAGDLTLDLAETGATVFAIESDPANFDILTGKTKAFVNVHRVKARILPAPNADGDRPVVALAGAGPAARPQRPMAKRALIRDPDMVDLLTVTRDLIAGRVPVSLPESAGMWRPGRLALMRLNLGGEVLRLVPALHAAGHLAPVGCTLIHAPRGAAAAYDTMREAMAPGYARRKVIFDWC
ncbi:MAG: hypothetical protein AAF919_02315 [Pseudomonadota bacterium]